MKKTAFLLGILTLVQVFIFLKKDDFQYIPYAGYEELYGPCKQRCLNKWETFVTVYTQQDLDKTRNVLRQIGVEANQPDTTKIRVIAKYLYMRFGGRLLAPDPQMGALSPFQQFNYLNQHPDAKLWCGNFAAIFTYFSWTAGIPSRYIEFMNPGDHHVVSECYLKDKHQWALVDLTNNIILPAYSNKLLNTQDFIRSLNKGSLFYPGADQLKKYYRASSPFYYFHHISLEKAYTPFEKAKRYLLPASWYEIYPESGGNSKFYLKQALIAIWLINLAVLVFQYVTKKRA